MAAAGSVFPREPGRPSRGLLPYYERMNLADWIEEQAEEHRKNGSRKPIMAAEIDLYELMFSGEERPPDLLKFRKNLKKKRLQGRRDLLILRRKLASEGRGDAHRRRAEHKPGRK